MIIPLLGLAGEVGELASEYKKYLRDGDAYKLFNERIAEELGDILWYLSTVATKFGLDLEDIATANLGKCRDRWGNVVSSRRSFDHGFPDGERLPRRMIVELTTVADAKKTKAIAYLDGARLGNELTDNAYEDDGYRWHDLFHLSCAAILGWSPVLRKLLDRKRRSQPKVDEVEDGGRATAIEEGLAALVFSYAGSNLFDGAKGVSHDLLRTIKSMTAHLEVSERSAGDWERTIMTCFEVWRGVQAAGGGRVLLDLERRELKLLRGRSTTSPRRSRSRRRPTASGRGSRATG